MKHTLHWNYELKGASTEEDESKSLEEKKLWKH